MRSFKSLAILTIAISWTLANTAWLTIGEEELVGTELIQLLNLLPAIALLLIFIASYRKLEKTLLLLAAAAMTSFALLAVFTDLTSTAAAIKVYEALSGIQGAGASDVEVASVTSLMPWVSVGVAIIAIAFLVLSAFKPGSRSEIKRQEVEDNRALWDEQGD